MKKRNTALDVIRCTALFCVVSLHFFLHCGYYGEVMLGIRMFVMTVMRNGFLICTPLFMMLSGYLIKTDAVSINYYKKLGKTLSTYFLASLFCGIYKMHTEQIGIFKMLSGILSYTTAPYSWYVNMYIGMFFFIPYLNRLYNSLETKEARRTMVLTLIGATALPLGLNCFRFNSLFWWLKPTENTQYHQLVPDFWVGIFPIMYFYLGAYLRDYPLKIAGCKKLILFVATTMLSGMFSYYRSYGTLFIWGIWNDEASPFAVVQAVLLFEFLSEQKFEKLGNYAGNFLGKLSDLCFGAYLTSYVFDEIFYRILAQVEADVKMRLNYFVPVVLAVFACSLAASAVCHWINTMGSAVWNMATKKKA